MAQPRQQRGGGGGKIVGVGLLVALLGLVAAYFGQCVPGFGVGGGDGSVTSVPTPPTKATPTGDAQGEAADALVITVDGERCRQGDAAPQPCADVCTAITSEAKTRKVLVQATGGTHAAVEALRKCIAEQGFVDVVVRVE